MMIATGIINRHSPDVFGPVKHPSSMDINTVSTQQQLTRLWRTPVSNNSGKEAGDGGRLAHVEDGGMVCGFQTWDLVVNGMHVSGHNDKSIQDLTADNINLAASRWAAPLVEALESVQSQCSGHCDEFSWNVWMISERALEKFRKGE
jgi:hypothetical protein